MDNESLKELCNEGFFHARLAYEKAKSGTPEESLAQCFKVLFRLLRDSLDDDTQPIKID